MTDWQADSSFKTRLTKALSGVLLCLLAGTALARPAAWYWWASKVSDDRVCAQTSPGAGWVREATAFRDSRCSQRVKPF
ncbi:MAG: hypothetical protein KA538_01655 [Azonexus sp.]|jgi:hypothetical protein|nr:hypothetical protein [Azonexus sp.]